MANQQVDLDGAHTAILDSLRTRFPFFQSVGDYGVFSTRDKSNKMKVPACLLSVASIEPDEDGQTGTEQFDISIRWELRVILDVREKTHDRDLRRVAADLALWINNNRFGLEAGPAEFLSAAPDQFDPHMIQLSAWLIEFQQSLRLGESCYAGECPIPSEVYLGYTPNIGPDHIEDYEDVTDVGLPDS